MIEAMGPTGIESVGEAVTGGLAARAVEPETGEAGEAEGNCLNCGTELVGAYCHACGQAGHVHRTLSAFGHDLLHSVLHFEGKIWRTLPLLAWRPGELTRRYVHGERAKFVSPMALFLLSVFLMFAIFSAFGANAYRDGVVSNPEAAQDLAKESAESSAELQRLEKERERLRAAGQPTADMDEAIRDARQGIEIERAISERIVGADGPAKGEVVASPIEIDTSDGADAPDWFNAAYRKAKENPALLLYKLQSNGYKFSWLLIPLSVPFVWLLFLHRRRYRQYRFYDHTVFVTYSIAFMSMVAIAFTLMTLAGWQAIAIIAFTFIPPIHMYRQLRGAYQLSRWSALWRTFALLLFASIAAVIFFLILLTIGVAA